MLSYLLAIYWLIGCFCVGANQADRLRREPATKRQVDSGDLVAVIIWPALAVCAIICERTVPKN